METPSDTLLSFYIMYIYILFFSTGAGTASMETPSDTLPAGEGKKKDPSSATCICV
jgi:hypothetical protein